MARPVPLDSARMAWWMTAWLRGTVGPDELRDAVLGSDAAHDVAGLPDEDEPLPLLLAGGRLRRLGATSVGLALAEPGDLVGLGGPPAFNLAASEQGEAVIVDGAGLGLVPVRAGAGVVWQAYAAHRRPLDDLGTADRTLRRTVLEAAATLAELDVARWRPEVADELMNLRHRTSHQAPAGTPGQAVDLAARAFQALGITDLALADDGNAVTAREAAQRSEALRPLARAGRRALVAACSPEAWPPE